MNILSVTQLQTQTARADLSQILPSERDTKIDSDKPSFARALEDAQKTKSNETESEKTEKGVSADERKVAENDARPESDEGKKICGNERKSNDAKSEKIARNVDEGAEIEQNPAAVLSSADEIAARIQNFNNIVQNAVSIEENDSIDGEKLELASDDFAISEKNLSWLVSSAGSETNDEISEEDFTKMIDAAVEFIPGFESEEEKLESAQNLAANDPKFFLETVEINPSQLAEMQRGAQKSDLPLDSDKKISSAKNVGEKKKDSKLSVYDLRTLRISDADTAKVDSAKIVQKAAEKKEITLSMQQQNENNVQMTMELAAKAQENITSSSAQAAGAQGSDFQAMLSNAVQENAPDFVKAGNIVLKDNNQGSINLILRPEGLGNVKISLNLDDKNLSAQITVQTKEAMDAFRESIPSLKQAFTESGFETGSFDLNFSDNQNQQGFAQSGEQRQNQQNPGILAHKSYGEFVTADALASGEMAESSSVGSYAINIVA
ncbi:MAG: flagellar hook-length control protein FliK [Treponema sp.]|uniref:flagellar hook-length control protein FliK n=1 Tax=Treponema sp. TaxID=166 RepID=UPI0025FBF2B9|nr:flagellar hook-length control protein FliK [Treponema sp.]MBQ9282976.1 flagellar hook-length control protein FliK [Treponema sp.]